MTHTHPNDQPEFNRGDFDGFLAQHKLMGSRCQACGETFLPPRALCPACFESQMAWVELSGKGTLEAFTVVYIAPTAMLEAGYGRDHPYCSGIVRLEDGPGISALILGADNRDPGSIQVGAAVEFEPHVLHRVTPEGELEQTALAFRLVA